MFRSPILYISLKKGETPLSALHDKKKLETLITETKDLLENRGAYFTEGAKLAINDVLKDAESASNGTFHTPFVRSRAFYKPRNNESISFTLNRFTMVPTYLEEGKVYGYYGLEPALHWFRQQDILYGGKEKLLEKATYVISSGKHLLNEATLGIDIGHYSKDRSIELREALDNLRKIQDCKNTDSIAKAVVDCFNKMRLFRHSQILRTDIDDSATLFLTENEFQQVKEKVHDDPLIKKQFAEIKKIAQTYSLEYIEKAFMFLKEHMDYEQVNQNFYVWSSTDKIVNFTVPEKATTANVSFILPKEENEDEGLGHIWIDNLDIVSANGGSLDILNKGFDEGETSPQHWTPNARRGNPLMKWENEYPFSGGGDHLSVEDANPSSQKRHIYKEGIAPHALYIKNPTGMDEGSGSYDHNIPIESGGSYTLTFDAKIDGKLKKGLKTRITFKDNEDNKIDHFTYYFNRKSSLPNNCFLLTMQCDAILYAFSKDTTYAEKVKKQILFTLNEFCQGAEHWLVHNARPDGSDSYGAVQGGRVLSSIASSYSLIKEARAFTNEEKDHFYALIEYMLRYMLDLRDRTELSPIDAQKHCTNWQTDMCAGTGLMMMVLDDFPNRKTWLYNATYILRSQLELNVNKDGSWPESIRYHHAALERFAVYAKALQNLNGDNWFADTSLSHMFDYSINMQTPPYQFFNHHIGTPPFGDHALEDGQEFGSFGVYLSDVEKINQDIADRMYLTWEKAGKPFKKLWGEAITFENLLAQGSTYQPASNLMLNSTQSYSDSGIYVFRKNYGQKKESYFAIMSSYKPIGHGHLDQGAFIIYKDSIPIIMDSGIEGYFDSSTQWHISSYSHACLQFATTKNTKQLNQSMHEEINLTAGTYSLERGWVDVPRTSEVLDCQLQNDIDMIKIKIMNPEGPGYHIRQIWYIKEPDLYIICDSIKDFSGNVLFNLPVASINSEIKNNRVYSKGPYHIDLETIFLNNIANIELEKGRSTKFFNNHHSEFSMMDYIRATASGHEGVLTLLHPKRKGDKNIEIKNISHDTTIILVGNKHILIKRKYNHLSVKLLPIDKMSLE